MSRPDVDDSIFDLDGHLRPSFYELKFEPKCENADEPFLDGVVRIHVNATEKGLGKNKFTINAMRLTVKYAYLWPASGETELVAANVPAGANFPAEQPADAVELDVRDVPGAEQLELTSSVPLPERAVILIGYNAPIEPISGEKDSGLHSTRPGDPWWLVTHLEPTNARYLYPCFDDPTYKAKFQVTVVFPVGYTVVSNTLVENRQVDSSAVEQENEQITAEAEAEQKEQTSPRGARPRSGLRRADGTDAPHGMQVLRFKQTHEISPYLVSIACGKLRCLSTETKGGLITRVFIEQEHAEADGWYVLDLLTKAVEFYESFFGFQLPQEKLDIVGIPQFKVLGMENWGMLCFHMDYMMVSETTPIERRQRIARLVGHEVAHQWFGNIISLREFRYIWLKEGFCRYLEFFFVNHVFPRWNIWGEFLAAVYDAALKEDFGTETHPIEVPVKHPRKVFDFFDIISYGKAGSVLRMLASVIGEAGVRDSMQKLIQTHAYSVIDTENFCDAIKASVPPMAMKDVDVGKLINEWVSKPGHPYVLVERLDDGTSLTVSQFVMPSYANGPLTVGRPSSGDGIPLTSPRMSIPTPRSAAQGGNVLRSASRVLKKHPKEYMEEGQWTIPIKLMEILQGRTSTSHLVVLQKPTTDVECTGGNMAYFNPVANAVCRVDYATELWRNVFEVSPFLSVLDRLSITITLFSLQFHHVGSLGEDRAERCTLLLEWLNELCIGQCEKHFYLWKFLSNALWRLANMIRSHPCWYLFKKFVTACTQHLVLSQQFSFFARENRTEFKGSHNLSDQVVSDCLHLLCFCRSPSIADEVRTMVDWTLSRWVEGHPVPENLQSKELNITDSVTKDRVRIALEYAVSSTERSNVVWAVCIKLVRKLLRQSDMDASVLRETLTKPLEATDLSAMEETESEDDEYFAVVQEELPDDVVLVDDPEVFQPSKADQRQAWLEALLPAVVIHPNPAVFELILDLLADIPNVDYNTLRCVTRNIRLAKYIVQQPRFPQLSFAPYLVYFSAISGPADPLLLGLFYEQESIVRNPRLNKYMEMLERQYQWTDYVSPHYTEYLSKQLGIATGSGGLGSAPDGAGSGSGATPVGGVSI